MTDLSFEDLLSDSKSFFQQKCEEIEAIYKAEKSLHEFLKQSWHVSEPDVFIDGWHLHAMAEHIEALMNREIKNLLINIPPRMGKTSLISIALPAWQWLRTPSERFVYAAHSSKISLKDSVACRRLIQSPWYQGRWGHKLKLLRDQNTKGRFDNDKSGYRISTSVGSTVTGEGGTVQVCVPYDTLITTDRGRIWIGEIVHDRLPYKVLTYNEKKEIIEYKEIEEYENNGKRDILEIRLDDDRVLECTEDHPIFVKGVGWLEAQYLEPGHVVYSI